MITTPSTRSQVFLFCIVFFSLLCSSSISSAQTRKAAPQGPAQSKTPKRLKVAEGKYELKKLNGPVERTFEEPWSLYKTDFGYELAEQWLVGAGPNAEANVIDVKVSFVSGLHPLSVHIGSDEERALNCSLALKEFTCKTRGLEARLPMEGIYDFFSPSPWMLGSIARRAKKTADEITSVQLVRMAGVGEQGPRLASFHGEVQYVGDDQVEINHEKFSANIYELKSKGAIPSMMLWISTEGIVLAMQDSREPEQRMELVEFKKFAKF